MKRALIHPDKCRKCTQCRIELNCSMEAVIRESSDAQPWIDFYRCAGCLKCISSVHLDSMITLANKYSTESGTGHIDSLWKRVYAYADKAYNLDKTQRIIIHGDGATWIKRGLDVFGDADFALDGFHLRKRLMPFISVAGSECIYKLLNEGRKEDFESVARSVISDCKDAAKKKTLNGNLK